jgi:phosphoadenosine phosphosulfate reductase
MTFSERELAHLNETFENAFPAEILQWAADTYGEDFAVVTSFQPTGIITLHMLSEIAPRTPILTLDTGLLFPETYALIETFETQYDLNIIRVRPRQTVQEQAWDYGEQLWTYDPNLCCNVRKVIPLDTALNGKYSAWVTGLRRDQSQKRANTPIVSWDAKREMVKLCPFATWTEDMIWAYLLAHELPYNPLHDQGYPSIGCKTCTASVIEGDGDKRAGRWTRHEKTECGIHLPEVTAVQGT